AFPQGNFPYFPLRALIAIAGSLLAVVIFLIAALLYRNIWFATLSASFVVFDNALIVYSRTILPEMLLLLFGFSGILCWILSDQAKHETNENMRGEQKHWLVVWGLFLIAAVLWALAASMKLTGLGFLLTASLFLLYRKQYAKLIAAWAMFALVYSAVFFIFFSTIKDSTIPYTHFRNQAIQKIDFSTPKTLTNFIPFFIQHHRATLVAHTEVPTDPAIHPLRWPLYHRSIGFWGTSNSERINVSGNMVIWTSTTLAVLVALVMVTLKKFKYSAAPFPIPTLPLIGYLANYVPFVFVPRALYLYHYFAALIFGFLLLPALVQFFASLAVDKSSQRKKIALALILCAILWYILLIPRTYGVPFYSIL
ncbi:MAG TPA: phospholipid carrier-dependent glycosyltransferase, partial [Candidatus Paceibacterota bacterium]